MGSEIIDDSFENFFNNESLSDRLLVITEVEEIFPIPSNDNEAKSGVKRSHIDLSRLNPKRICISDHNNGQEDEDDGTFPITLNIPNIADQIHEEQNEDKNLEKNDEQNNGLDYATEAIDITEDNPTNNEESVDVDIVESQNDSRTGNKSPICFMQSLGKKIKLAKNVKHCEVSDSPLLVKTPIEVINKITPKIEINEMPQCSNQQDEVQNNSFTCLEQTSMTLKEINTISNCSSTGDAVEKRVIKETRVYVHSVILAAKSEFFKCLFATSGMKETKEKEIKIEISKSESESMMILLHCFYNRNYITSHSLQTVLHVCNLAMKYCYDGLIEKCLDIFRCRAENIIDVDDINQIALMVSKIESELHQHKEKCVNVMKTCGPYLVNSFYPIDEFLEKSPDRFYQLHLNSMYLFLDANVQERFNKEHGNLFIYAMQKWLRAHFSFMNDEKYKEKAINFIEKLLNVTELKYVTGDFLTNIMTYEHSPFALWPGYKDWYIKALQTFVFEFNLSKKTEPRLEQRFPIIKRRRISKFVRQERNADIFSLTHPVILNGFEIGIYFRVREDNKVHIICKCKNILINKTGFDQCSLLFRLKGNIKLNVEQDLWCEQFPAAHNHWINDWFSFSYKQNTMCLQMYGICKLSPMIYELAKKYGFFMNIQLQQIK